MSKYDNYGGYFAPKGVMKVEAGGSHAENPNGGVQIGMDEQGVPNLLEEGEPVFNDYVFSDNIYANGGILKKFNIPEKFAKKLYSEIAEHYIDEVDGMELDPIANRGLNANLVRLMNAQEEQKMEKERRELEKMLAQMSPEEIAALEQELAAAEGGQEMPVQEQVPVDQQMIAQAPVEEAAPMEMPVEQVPVMAAEGGLIRRFDMGGPTGEGRGGAYLPGYDDGKTLDLYGGIIDPAVSVAYPGKTQAWVDAETSGIKRNVAEGSNQFISDAYDVAREVKEPFYFVPGLNGLATADDIMHGYFTGDKKEWQEAMLFGFLRGPKSIARGAKRVAKSVGKLEKASEKITKANKAIEEARKAKADNIRTASEKLSELQKKAKELQDATTAADKTRISGEIDDLADAYDKARKEARKGTFEIAGKVAGKAWDSAAKAVQSAKTSVVKLVDGSSSKSVQTPGQEVTKTGWQKTWPWLAGLTVAGGTGYGIFGTGSKNNSDDSEGQEGQSPVMNFDDEPQEYDWSLLPDLANAKALGGKIVRRFDEGGDADIDWNSMTPEEYERIYGSYPVGGTGYGSSWTDEKLSSVTGIPMRNVATSVSSPKVGLVPSRYTPEMTPEEYFRIYGVWPSWGLRPYRSSWTREKLDSINGVNSAPVVQADELVYDMDPAIAVADRPDRSSYYYGNGEMTPEEYYRIYGTEMPSGYGVAVDSNWTPEKLESVYGSSASSSGSSSGAAGSTTTTGSSSSSTSGQPGTADEVVNGVSIKNPGRGLLTTLPRYAGVVGNSIAALSDAFAKPDSMVQNYAEPVLPVGRIDLQPEVYNPTDMNHLANMYAAQMTGANRMLRNSGLGPSVGANIIAANNAGMQNLGSALLQGRAANNQLMNNVIAANNQSAAQKANFDYTLDAARANILNDYRYRRAANDMTVQQYNNAQDTAKWTALGQQLGNVWQGLSDIGNENFAMNQVNTNPALFYRTTQNGGIYYDPMHSDYLEYWRDYFTKHPEKLNGKKTEEDK